MNILTLILLMANLSNFAEGEYCAQKILEADDSTFAKLFKESYKQTETGKLITREEAIAIAKNFVGVKNVVWGAVSVENFWVVRFDPCSSTVRGGAGMLLISSQSKSVVHSKFER